MNFVILEFTKNGDSLGRITFDNLSVIPLKDEWVAHRVERFTFDSETLEEKHQKTITIQGFVKERTFTFKEFIVEPNRYEVQLHVLITLVDAVSESNS
jgi:hypothetical protein